jgi:thimet oligopeptidase
MKLKTMLLVALATAIHSAPAMAAPHGVIAQPTATEIPKWCQQSVTQARARIDKIKKLPIRQVSVKTVLHAWNELDTGLQDIGGPIGLLSETSPDPAVRKAAEACDLVLSALPNEYLQSETLFQRVKALTTTDPIDAMASV